MVDEADLAPEGEGNEAALESGADDAEIERRARLHGWVPESEWDAERAEREGRRKPARFQSKEEFLEDQDTHNKKLRGAIKRLESRFGDMESRLSESADLLRSEFEQRRKKEFEAYERGRQEALARQRQAARDADPEAHDKAMADAEAYGKAAMQIAAQAQEQRPQPQQPRIAQEVLDWHGRNQWFKQDRAATAYMMEIHDKQRAEVGDELANSEEYLEEAKKQVMQRFPEKFGRNPRREAARTVATPSGERSQSKSSAKARFDALPPDERATLERMRKMFKDTKGHDWTYEEMMESYGQ